MMALVGSSPIAGLLVDPFVAQPVCQLVEHFAGRPAGRFAGRPVGPLADSLVEPFADPLVGPPVGSLVGP